METRYEKVRFVDGERTRAVFLRIARDSGRVVAGTEVDKYGDEIAGSDFTERLRIIDKALIVSRRRYVLDRHYGELVPARGGT